LGLCRRVSAPQAMPPRRSLPVRNDSLDQIHSGCSLILRLMKSRYSVSSRIRDRSGVKTFAGVDGAPDNGARSGIGVRRCREQWRRRLRPAAAPYFLDQGMQFPRCGGCGRSLLLIDNWQSLPIWFRRVRHARRVAPCSAAFSWGGLHSSMRYRRVSAGGARGEVGWCSDAGCARAACIDAHRAPIIWRQSRNKPPPPPPQPSR